MRMLPFPVSLTEKGDSRSVCSLLDLWCQVVFFYERLNNGQFKGFGDIS